MFSKIIPRYIKTEAQRDAYFFSTLMLFFSIYVTTYERSLMPKDVVLEFSLWKYTASILGFAFSFVLTFKPANQVYVFLTALASTFYTVVGEYYAPLYHYAFVMIMLAISILLRPNFKIFTPVVIIGQAILLYVQNYKIVNNPTYVREAILQDYIMISIEFTVLILVINEGYSKRRKKEIEHRERLSLLGQDVNIFAHNIKSMMSSHFIISDNLNENINNPKVLKETLEVHDDNLKEITSYLNSFNLLEKTEKCTFNVKDSVMTTLHLLSIPMDKVSLTGEAKIECIKQDFDSILINILSNGKKSTKINGKIEIKISKNELIISNPIIENYEVNSGVGEVFTTKLAKRNNLELEITKCQSLYTHKIKYLY